MRCNLLYLQKLQDRAAIDLTRAAVVELVDTSDSKYDVHSDVPVQVRPAVPVFIQLFSEK